MTFIHFCVAVSEVSVYIKICMIFEIAFHIGSSSKTVFNKQMQRIAPGIQVWAGDNL